MEKLEEGVRIDRQNQLEGHGKGVQDCCKAGTDVRDEDAEMAEWFHNDGQNKGKVCKTVVRPAMMYGMRMVRWLSGFTMMGRIRERSARLL